MISIEQVITRKQQNLPCKMPQILYKVQSQSPLGETLVALQCTDERPR